MKPLYRVTIKPTLLFVLFTAGLLCFSDCLADNQQTDPANYAPNQIIVKLKNGKAIEDLKELKYYYIVSTQKVFSDTSDPRENLEKLKDTLSRMDSEHDRWYWQLDKDSKEYTDYQQKIESRKKELQAQISAIEELIAHLEQRQARAPQKTALPDTCNTYLLKVESSTGISAIAEDFAKNPDVEYAEPDYRADATMVPNDPYYSTSGSWGQSYADLWTLKKIGCETAWNYSQGSGVIVAVIDTGVDYNHSELQNALWNNARETAGNAADDDKNGYVDDIKGWNFVARNNNPMDDSGHGTHLCGIIAAAGNNSKGIIGIAPKVKIMALKGLDSTRSGYVSDLVNAIKYAADNGADIINMSWCFKGDSQSLADAVQYAYAKGCVLIAAAGNNNENVSLYSPAKLMQVITVASTDHNDIKSDFSNYGSLIDISAPGGDSYNTSAQKNYINILSLKASCISAGDQYVVGANYYRIRGTSMSAPYVAGLSALLLSAYPDWSNELVRIQLKNTADSINGLNPSYSGWLGKGRINANNALSKTYRISGYVRDNYGNGISGVTVRFSNLSYVTTNSSGYYVKNGIPNGTFVITPSKTGYSLPTYTVTLNNKNWNINFTGYRK